jgi:hypothetical protein
MIFKTRSEPKCFATGSWLSCQYPLEGHDHPMAFEKSIDNRGLDIVTGPV